MTYRHTPFIKYPDKAPLEIRLKFYEEWCKLHEKNNPGCWLPRGVKKKWWQFWVHEHPFTKIDSEKKS